MPTSNPYEHVQDLFTASNTQWHGLLHAHGPTQEQWAVSLIRSLIILGGADISYIESDVNIDNPDVLTTQIWAVTSGRIAGIHSELTRYGSRDSANTFARNTLQSLDLVSFKGGFDKPDLAIDRVALTLHFPTRELKLGQTRGRSGYDAQAQDARLVALLPSFLEDVEAAS